ARDFGGVNIGSSKDLSCTVKNTGVGTLIGDVAATAPYSVVSGEDAYNLPAGQSTTVHIRFSPTSGGTFVGDVSFTGGVGASQLVTGTGVLPPTLFSNPSSWDFGSVTVGTSKDLSFLVTNTGGGILTGNVNLSGPFSIVSG